MRRLYGRALSIVLLMTVAVPAPAQEARGEDAEFGPVVRAYLGYLRNEQEVVDDRNSRHEISPRYYRRNSSRIRALRQMAIRIARETGNDYLPELEAMTLNELGNLFENPPPRSDLRIGRVFSNTFRFLGTVRAGETFYVFARLDPYEQAELIEQEKQKPMAAPQLLAPTGGTGQSQTRPRRASTP